jgi:hypothetical protein
MRQLHATGGSFDSLPFWSPTISVELVTDFSVYPRGGIPSPIAPSLRLHPATGAYTPPLVSNQLWERRDTFLALNASTPDRLPLRVDLAPVGLMRWQLQAQMAQSLELQAALHGEEQVDEVSYEQCAPWAGD